jgi:hypothetical protein
MFLYLHLFVVLTVLFFSTAITAQAGNTTNTSSTNTKLTLPKGVASIKEVNSICLGTISGRADQVFLFKRYLNDQLIAQGFIVTNDPTSCDAVLEGNLHTTSRNLGPIGLALVGTWTKILAAANMQLKNQNNQLVWKKNFKPYFSFKNPDYVKTDGKSGCAVNIAKAIKASKFNATK